MQTAGNRQLPQRHPRRESGFTLLELMVVAAIIIIVVGMLSAALTQTRTRTMRVACLNNMKQLQLAWTMYADDHSDFIALNRTAPRGPGNIGIAAAPRNSTNSWVAGNPKEDRTTENITRGTLFPYVKASEVYRCPMDTSTTRSGTARTRSYSINAYLGGDDDSLDSRVKTKVSDLATPGPDRVFVFIEEHEESVWGGGFVVLPREQFSLNGGAWNSTPSDRHMQGCNLTFADNHLEYWKWRAPKRANLNNTVISSPKDLRDLRRLQESIPQR
jgi:type II secretory pathway pseudopilin PulG